MKGDLQMRKILTLALALVLVFAIAAPALAITGDTTPDVTDTEGAPVKLDVALLTAPPVATAFGGFQVSEVAANKAYIVNEVCYYGVAVNFPEADLAGGEVFDLDPVDYEGAVLSISSDAIAAEDDTAADVFNADGDAVAAAYALVDGEWTVNAGEWGSGDTVYFFGQGLVKAKGVLKAEIALEPVWDLQIFDGLDLLYTVTENAGVSFIVDPDTTDLLEGVRFDIDDDDEVTNIAVNDLDVEFKKLVSGGGSVVASIGGFTSADDEFEDLYDLYNEVMTFFGFNYDAEGRLLAKHFEAKSHALNMKAEVAVQLYTADIVVPGGVVPPKTGDAATVVGFVMIVVAMIAAGVVVSRKVRA
jgi:hypothetical protein